MTDDPDKTADTPKVKVLIVDDSRLTRVSLKTTLHQAKEDILFLGEAEEGREGISMAERLRPDVILMDIGMPILDGIRATQEIHKRLPDIKVVMLTSHEDEAEILESFQAGATSYCLKDTPPETLVQVVLSTARGENWIDPKIARVVLRGLKMPSPSGNSDEQPSGETAETDLLEPTTYSLLTEREVEVLQLITEGLNNAEISERLCVSLNTVKTHIKNIFQKLEVEDRTAAAMKAVKERII
ncbi:MAG: response regulator transcription factor [Vampirovibrio sp.]|nr:response regulator transcription factor [Vampirovibrio sp.]